MTTHHTPTTPPDALAAEIRANYHAWGDTPAAGRAAFLDDPGGMLDYYGLTIAAADPDAVALAAIDIIRRELDQLHPVVPAPRDPVRLCARCRGPIVDPANAPDDDTALCCACGDPDECCHPSAGDPGPAPDHTPAEITLTPRQQVDLLTRHAALIAARAGQATPGTDDHPHALTDAVTELHRVVLAVAQVAADHLPGGPS